MPLRAKLAIPVLGLALSFAAESQAASIDFDSLTLDPVFASAGEYSFRSNAGNGILRFGNGSNTGTQPSGSRAGGFEDRFVTTTPLDLSAGGIVSFDLLIGNSGSTPYGTFEDADPGEDIGLYFSVDGGASFTQMALIDTEAAGYQDTFGLVSAAIPAAAQTASTLLHIAQINNSGSFGSTAYDAWAIDNFTYPDAPAVPLPAPFALLGGGLLLAGAIGRRRKG